LHLDQSIRVRTALRGSIAHPIRQRLERELYANQLLRNIASHIIQQRLSWRNKRNTGKAEATVDKVADDEGFRGPVVPCVASGHAAPEDADYLWCRRAGGRRRPSRQR
jgi:hypothetical protein